MGIWDTFTSGNLLGGAGLAGSSGGGAPGRRSGRRTPPAPAGAPEWDCLIDEMRAAFEDADLTDRQLTQGGEEGLTYAQCRR